MKQAVSKRLSLLAASIQYTFRAETAHFSNNWGSVASTCLFTIANIIFINVLYANVKTIAGYSRDEMLLFMLMGQISYYSSWLLLDNLADMIEMVNNGLLDLVLARPVPSLFYITFKQIKVFSVLRDCIPPLAILVVVIRWPLLHLTFLNALSGLTICFIGLICAFIIHFLASLSVFWIGQSTQILTLSQEVEYNIGKIIPYEGFGKQVQIFFTLIVPYLISAGVSTSVMLGKTPAFIALVLVFGVMLLLLWIRQWMWQKALRVYSSASS